MAGSRLQKFGTIFTRTTGLLRSGAIAEDGRPLWYDIYKRFPPHVEPNMFRPVPNVKMIDILYPEDYIRARFYNTYGSPGLVDMTNQISGHKSLSQKFIDKYIEIGRKSGDTLTDDQLFEATEEALISEGFRFKLNDKQLPPEVKPNKFINEKEKEIFKTSVKKNPIIDIAMSEN